MSEQIEKQIGYYLINIISVGNDRVFTSSDDYQFFLSLFKYLLPGSGDNNLIESDLVNYSDSIHPLAYRLIPTGCEILVRCRVNDKVASFTDDLMSLYAAYFFDKYGNKLLDDYEISEVNETELLEASRALHTKSPNWRTYQYSSLRAYMYDDGYDWLEASFIKGLSHSTVEYLRYLEG